jgi:hypothetical protein
MNLSTSLRLAALAAAMATGSAAHAVPVSFTKLTGLVGAPGGEGTAVYKADLASAGLGDFAAILINDTSGGFGGATGQFTGFDLDAIKLSTTNCATAACASSAAGMSLFDFVSGVVFTPGTQRAPADPKLFGTGPTGSTLDDSVARLGSFDGFSSTVTPDGFISLGDNGSIGFNLTALTSTAGLYMYIGEVGDNGEVAGSSFDLRTDPIPTVPEPETYALMLGGLGIVAFLARRRKAG